MKVLEAIRILKYAELSQLKVKEDPEGVMTFLDSGILEIHKRIALIQGDAVITPVEGKLTYSLLGDDVDVQMPSAGRLLEVSDITDKNGYMIPINNRREEDSVFIVNHGVLTFKSVTVGNTIHAMCQMAPENLEDTNSTIELPPQLFEALFHYVGYRAHCALNGSPQEEGFVHYKRFENSVTRVLSEGLFIQDNIDSHKFEARGFV